MYRKLKQYYDMEACDLLYLAAFLDPLHSAKIQKLGADDMTEKRAMDLLACRLDTLLESDGVHFEVGEDPAAVPAAS